MHQLAIGSGRAIVLSLAALAAFPLDTQAQDFGAWQKGYVFCGTGASKYRIFTNDGVFVEQIDSGFNVGNTTGGAFDANGDLWTTEFQAHRVTKYDKNHPHSVLLSFITPATAASAESILFDANGDFYVGHADGDRDIYKYKADGTLITNFNVAVGPRGTDWIELSKDQKTMFYTSEGRVIRRYDVSTNTQLPDFATIAGSGNTYALRLLAPFDGTGGLIVADSGDMKRLSGTGTVTQTYDDTNRNLWFAMNLDPNGTSCWGADLTTNVFYRFNIATGAIELGPIASGGNQLAGIVVAGEISGGNLPPEFEAPSPCNRTLDGMNGVPLSFTVRAKDDNAGDIVELSATGVPAGATFTPPLPTSGNPVQSVFNWTPTLADIGLHTIVVTAKDRAGLRTTCTIRLLIASECHLLFSAGKMQFDIHQNDFALLDPYKLLAGWPVIESIVPEPFIPNDATLKGVQFFGQVLLFNPWVFPSDPIKMSNGLDIVIGNGHGKAYGPHSGLFLQTVNPVDIGQKLVVKFGMVK